ncbi:hypothetical protein [Coprobacillus sp. AF33-1AC]|uniref:hypothetical protein n=1 Tax=Coprobacillus sp. AF33-1AC TaxID=2292032 RepID=UPI001314C355|nr:hypothetical protein [Coprobacillus sp. AF33-1AC]
MASIPEKQTVPSNISMSNQADIQEIQNEIIQLYKLVNQLIEALNNAVFYKD